MMPPAASVSAPPRKTSAAKEPKSAALQTIRPVGDRILLQFAAEKEQIVGGVLIPDSAKEKSQEANVIALGTGRKAKDGSLIPFEVKVGDTVLVAGYGGTEVKLDGQKFTLIREDDILGILA